MTKSFFITGTGTGVGKTLITAALTWQLRELGHAVKALKPLISGFDETQPEGTDTAYLLNAQGLMPDAYDAISPWRFKAPLSPDMAAEDEGRAIDFAALTDFCSSKSADITLIEGVGGVMSPLDRSHTVLDWIDALQFPVILVAGTYLGALSHTLTAYKALAQSGVTIHAVVLSESADAPVSLERTASSLTRFLPPETRIHPFKRLDYSPCLWKDAPTLTSLVL